MAKLDFPDPSQSPYSENGYVYEWDGSKWNIVATPGSGVNLTLQDVTDNGNTTTNEIVVDNVNIGTGGNSNSTRVGQNALSSVTTGGTHVAVGNTALRKNTTGVRNTGIGPSALFENVDGNENVACGYQTLYNNTSGTHNTAIGFNAGQALTTGDNNTVIGCLTGTAGMSNTMLFGAGTTERFRVDQNGNMLIPNGTSPNISLSANGRIGTTNNVVIEPPSGGSSNNFMRCSNNNVNKVKLNCEGSLALGGDLSDATWANNDPNITLNASGSAVFEGDITIADGASTEADAQGVNIGKNGYVNVKRSSGNTYQVFIATQGTTETISMTADGNATFAGNIEAAGLTDGTTTKTMTEVLAGGGGDLTLQDVTNNGNTTTNTIKVNDNWFEGYRSGNGASQALSFKYDGGTGLTILADGTHWLGGDVSGFNPNITLNTNGSAEFAAGQTSIASHGGITCQQDGGTARVQLTSNGTIYARGAGTGSIFAGIDDGTSKTTFTIQGNGNTFIGDDTQAVGGTKITLNANGTASFAGSIKSGNIDTSATDVAGAQITPNGIFNLQRPSTDHPNAELAGFWYGDTRIFRFQNAGRLILGGADNGIQFGITDSGGNIASQTLNDYEEGTWTPTAQTGNTLSSVSANYIKVGNLVWFTLNAQLTTTGTPGSAHITGLPFYAKSSGSGGSRGAYPVRNVDNITDSNNGGAYVDGNVIYLQNSTGNGSASAKANITDVSFGITGCYEV